jgi:RNA polymerase sigma-70 factor (ECF subfamily)
MLADLLNRSADTAIERNTERDAGLLVAHVNAAYSLARCLLRNDTEAEDAVQEAFVRACEHFHTFRGGDGRSWLLAIVRNCCYDHLKRRAGKVHVEFDEETQVFHNSDPNPQSSLLRQEQIGRVAHALKGLPAHLCEVLVFREFEEMSYGEIATFMRIPIGTVMSRLSRARQLLRRLVFVEAGAEQAL